VSRGYETRDIDLRTVLTAAFGLTLAVVAFFALMWAMYVHFIDREAASSKPPHRLAAEQARKTPPEPRLQHDPHEDLLAMRAENERVLTTYGWVDETRGIVRIPIERAMELALRRGFPVRTDVTLAGEPDPEFRQYMRERTREHAGEEQESGRETRPAGEQHRKRRRGAR